MINREEVLKEKIFVKLRVIKYWKVRYSHNCIVLENASRFFVVNETNEPIAFIVKKVVVVFFREIFR